MANEQTIQMRLRMVSDFSDVTTNVSQIQRALKQIQLPPNLKNSVDDIFTDLERETKKYQRFLDSGLKKKSDITGLEASGTRISSLLKRLQTDMKKIDPSMLEKSFQVDPGKLQALESRIASLRTSLEQVMQSNPLQQLVQQAQTAANEISKISKTKFTERFMQAFKDGNIDAAAQALEKLRKNHKAFQDQAQEKGFTQHLGTLQTLLNNLAQNPAFAKITGELEQTNQQLINLHSDELTKLLNAFSQGIGDVSDFRNQFKLLNDELVGGANKQHEFNSELEMLKTRVTYFFGLTNSVQLFKRAITQALNTVKELDATMTEAAVVTDFSVGDMWDKLPQYADQAQKLGVSINGLYQATTLYYQQGLKTEAAMKLGVETMKMAKIAGIESSEATKAMTAALRGFNMELNETSATKVSDVYSKLAAITAADTNQIATAMSKTASIAASANMEFETTAALLAQIIETTQEAPETAGTALKTIVARFSEVKSLRSQGQSSGKDEEGEEIDVNRIQTALRTVGISMDGFFAGTEGLDSILLKLAEKWNTLDFETQRYIATMAAGSRQQSRFIAMMSDYGRTTELVNAANSSAGASQAQYNKTLESMESKLQRLKNAWNEFLMSLSNNTVLKAGIDILTFVINGINKLNDLISGGNGLTKSFASLITVVGGLAVGKRLLTGMLGEVARKTGLSTKKSDDGVETSTQKIEQSQQQAGQKSGEIGQQAGQNFGQQYVSGAVSAIQSGQGQIQQAMQQAGGVTTPQNGSPSKKFTGKVSQRKRLQDNPPKKIPRTALGGPKTVAQGPKTAAEAASDEAAAKNKLSSANERLADTEKKVVRETGDTAGAMDDSTSAAKKSVKTIGEVTGQMRAVGGAMMGAGAILGMLASLFEEMGETKLAEVISVIAAAFMGFGAILTVLPSLITAFGTTAVGTGIATQLAWWWLLVIAAVIVTIIALVYVLCKAFEAASDAAQFEKMSEQLSDLSAAADEAKEKLEAIADTRKELEQMGETFKTLTKGSREWKEALIENNSQVLELLNTYPELAKHIKTGLYGQMEITDLGWDTILESQQQAYANAYTAQTAQAQLVADKSMSMKIEQIAGEKVGKDFLMSLAEFTETGLGKAGTIAGAMLLGPATPLSDPMLWGGLGSALAFGTPSPEEVEKEQLGLTYEQYADYAAAVAEKGLSFATSKYGDLETVFKEMGFKGDFEDVYSSMKKLGQGFDELAQEAHAAKLAEEARVKAIISSNAQASEVVQGSEYSEAIQDFTSQQYENYTELTQKAASEWEYKEGSGTDNEKNAALITAYADAMKMTEDEVRGKIKDESLSYATMAATVGSDEVNKEMIKSMEALANGLERVGKKKTKKDMSLITGLMSEGGLGLTQKDLEKIKNGGDDLKAFLMDTYGFKDEELTDTQMNIFKQNRQAAKESLDNAYVYSESILGKETPVKGIINDLNKEFVSLGVSSGLSISQVQALANTLTDIAVRGGDAQETTELFGQMIEGIDSQNAELAQGIIAETDWSDELSIRSAVDSLRELGAQIDNTLISKVLQATRATRDFDLKNMTDQINKAKGVLNTIEGKKSDFSKTYTEKEKNELKEYGYTDKDFVWAGPDEYIFLGDTNALLEDILTQATTIADETMKGSSESIQKGIGIEDYLVDIADTRLESWLMGETIKEGHIVEGERFDLIDDFANRLEDLFPNLTLEDRHMMLANALRNDPADWLLKDEEASRIYAEIVNGATSEGIDFSSLESDQDAFRTLVSWAGPGTKTVEWKPTRQDLEQTARAFGMTDEEIAGYKTDEGLAERLRGDVNTYYKNLDKNMKNYFSGLDKASEITMYQVLGTGDVTDTQKEATSIQKALAESETEFYYKTSHGEDRKAEEYEKVSTSGLELAKLIAQGRVDLWGTGGTENVSESMLKTLASQMGIEVTDEMGQEELRKLIGETFWANFTIDEEGNAVERLDVVMDAYIGSHTGLAMAVENSVEQLRAEESAAANDTLAVKNLAVAVNKTGEAMDGLNGVLKDEAEFLELNDENNQQYRSALEKTATMAQLVFGKQVTPEFVAANRELFIQLTKGGAEAEEAYYKIGQAAARAALMTQFSEKQTEEAMALIHANLASIKPGETVDLAGWFDALTKILDGNKETAAKIIDTWGFSISYSVEADSYIATRESAIGTGVNAFDSGDKDVWENPYDMLYNTLERINEAIREREKLERRYQRLLKSEDVSGQKIVENLRAQTEQLQEEANLQNDVVVARKQQMQDLVDQKGLSQYAWIEDGKLRIDWGEIDKISDSDTGEEVEEYISQLEEWRDSLNEAEDRLEEIQDEVKEINDTGKEEYLELEQAIADALQESYQKQIDKLSDINDSINDANSRLIESIQSTIEKDRQERKNNETEQNIVDKQQQLAYLRQDTSGANALDILKLQEEIEQSQQDYTDTLIDQKISALQEQNEKAAEQRERQIEIAQQQLDQYIATGQHWSTVEGLIQSGTTETGKLLKSSELVTLLQEKDNFQGLSKQGKMDWMQSLEADVSAAWAWMQKHGQYIVNAGTQNNPDLGNVKGHDYTKSSGDGVSGDKTSTIKRLQKILYSEGIYSGKIDGSYGSQSKKAVLDYQKKYGLIQNDSNYQSVIKDYESRHTYEGIVGKTEPGNKGSARSGLLPGSHDKYDSNFTVDENGVSHITNQKVLAKQLTGDENAEVIYVPLWGGDIPKHLEKNRGRYFGLTKYKTGGLADYTGPAWLDGTKSKPELVLNARDTQNFIQLKDILGSLMGGSTKSTENSRVTNFDIDINVETVKDETDLEMIANYIENKIITSASYRNNNLIRSTR